ncbi:MAG: Zn-ribbon domain-containing OB-fold protein [Nitrososphaeraceae archaeon]
MRRFMNQLKNGTFVISYCTACRKKIWPPYEYCPACYRRASTVRAGKIGKIVEFSRSWLEEQEVIVALIDMDGILLLGSISEGQGITIGAAVELISNGASSDGKIYFHFRTLGSV